MPTITVTPQYINPPPAGKKYANINANKVYYSFDPEKISLETFRKGVAVTIDYEIKPYNGKDYYTITKVVSSAAAPATTGATGGNSRMSPEESMKVTRLAIAKSCIEAKEPTSVADLWLEWVLNQREPDAVPY